jgi:uncharacterized membrane protein YphA (DoxX/SURF4 family)
VPSYLAVRRREEALTRDDARPRLRDAAWAATLAAMSLSTVLVASAIWILITIATVTTNRSLGAADQIARAFGTTAIVISLLAFATGIASIAGALPPSAATRLVQQILIYRGGFVVGVALASVIMLAVRRPVVRAFVASPDVLRGLRVSLALSFLITEIAKLAHDTEMRQFFIESGYPGWFLYATITAETLGSIALLVASRRLVAPAAAGLAAIMIGAIYTHRHNGDPFEASLEATHLLTIAACTLLLDRSQKAGSR